MPGQVDPNTFYVSSGILFAVAIIAFVTRSAIRLKHFRKFGVDDGLILLAVTTLVPGIVLCYINVPLAYAQEQVEAGLQAPPPDFIEKLVADQRTQDASTVLLATTVVSVKYAFLFFFRKILERTGRTFVRWWWWFTLVVVTGCATVLVFSDFMACPYSGEDILVKCVTQDALRRETAVLNASVILDVISDALIISIPAAILWKLRLSFQKKLSLAAVLCLSIFMIICAIVRISLAWDSNGQVNTLWVILWLVLEACVALITVSASTFHSLFTGTGNNRRTEATEDVSKRHWYRPIGSSHQLEPVSFSNQSEKGEMNSSSSGSRGARSFDTQASTITYHHMATKDRDSEIEMA